MESFSQSGSRSSGTTATKYKCGVPVWQPDVHGNIFQWILELAKAKRQKVEKMRFHPPARPRYKEL